MIVPIFIHTREKSREELLEEMELEMKFRKAVADDEERQRERDRRRRERDRRRKEDEERERAERKRRANEEYEELRRRDEWQTQILPDGWSLTGQNNFGILTEMCIVEC